jgi:hypothetical protein
METRDDYFERQIAELRKWLAQIMKLRVDGHREQAMVANIQAQERLFGRPLAEFSAVPLDDQLMLLSAGMSPEQARERHVGYALLLREAGICYSQRDRDDLAGGAFKAALHILLGALLQINGGDEALLDLVRSTLAATPVEQIDAPIGEMLEAIDSR